jgi:hypothetical protein
MIGYQIGYEDLVAVNCRCCRALSDNAVGLSDLTVGHCRVATTYNGTKLVHMSVPYQTSSIERG